jgi:N-acetylneuraminic acid mutarotase
MEAYDPAAKTWSAKADAPLARSAAGAGVIAGRLYVVGGMLNSDANTTTDALAVYDSATDTWQNKSPMPTPLFGMAVGAINGKLYVAGGGDASRL